MHLARDEIDYQKSLDVVKGFEFNRSSLNQKPGGPGR